MIPLDVVPGQPLPRTAQPRPTPNTHGSSGKGPLQALYLKAR